ncbi:MAG: helix-turn-helix transcriptional regulator [Holophagales bacterium]|jgi:DNA-binding Xre family transcriptional regulator|nr:helix-turn-helix transcriptional regulator [Holophagales bacterium]
MKNKRWPAQEIFVGKVKEFCRKNDLLTKRQAVKTDIVADLFNLNEDTLKQLLSDTSRRRPHFNTLAHIASVLGCAVGDFLDASGPPPTISPERWETLNERERMMASSFLSVVSSDDLSITEKEILHTQFQTLKDSLIELKKNAGK